MIPLTNVQDLVVLLTNPEDAARQLEEMRQLAESIERGLTIQGTIEEINALKRLAQQDRAQARDMLATAQIEEDAGRSLLAQDRTAFTQTMKTEREKFAEDRAEYLQRMRVKESALDTREAAAGVLEVLTNDRQERLTAKEAAAEKLAVECRSKLASLREYLKGV